MDGSTYYEAAVYGRVGCDESFHFQRRNLVAIGQDDCIVASPLESPKIGLGGMLYIQVFEVDGLLVGKCMENPLEQGPVLIAMNPVLVDARLHLLEFKARERMKGEPEPVSPIYHKVTNE